MVPRPCETTAPDALTPPVSVAPTVAPRELAVVDAALMGASDVDRLARPGPPPPAPLAIALLIVLSPLLTVVDSEFTPVDREPMLVEVDDDRLPIALFTPVDNDVMLVDSEPMPVELDVDNESMPVDVDVDRLLTLLLVVLRPVDSELIAKATDVDSDDTWLTLTASVGFTPGATLVSLTGAVAPTPPSVTLVCDGSSYWTELATPVDSETMPVDSDPMLVEVSVDRLVTVLLVVLRPVDRDVTLFVRVLMPAEVEVDRLPMLLVVVLRPVDRLDTLLFVVLRPVDSELTPVDSELMPVEVELDRLVTLLLVVLRPVDKLVMPVEVEVEVDSELTPVDRELMPLDVEVDRLVT